MMATQSMTTGAHAVDVTAVTELSKELRPAMMVLLTATLSLTDAETTASSILAVMAPLIPMRSATTAKRVQKDAHPTVHVPTAAMESVRVMRNAISGLATAMIPLMVALLSAH